METDVNIRMPKALAKIYNLAELRQKAVLNTVLAAYTERRISKMKAAEILGLDYEEINEILLKRGIPTIMNLTKEQQEISRNNMEKLAKSLNIEIK